MKRPEGFDKSQSAAESSDSARKRSAAPRKPKGEKAAATRSTTAKPTRAKPTQVKPAKAKASVTKPAAAAPRGRTKSGAAPALERRELRKAARTRRRYERSEIKRFTRRSRNRRLGWLVVSGVVLSVAALIAVAVYSPLLALRTVRVEGTQAVNADEVSAAIDGQLGTPLALLDYGRIGDELNAFPLIRSFVTEVIPPNTLVVHVTERAPVGVIASGARFAVVDPAGVVLSTSATRVDGIPLITVTEGGADGVAFRAVVEVLLALPESIRSRVGTASASSKDDVTLLLSSPQQRVVWGSAERSALKARVLTELLASRGGAADVEYDVSAPLSPVVRG